jgi:AcrR family transcriptional regulator
MRCPRSVKRFERRGYHHGNLREALVAAACQLILENGPHGFSLIEAARMADVSPSAPYRHFSDRGALLAEVARRGFEQFADRLERSWNGGAPDPITALNRMGRAYIDFAMSERASYAAMFEAEVDVDGDPGLKLAAERAHKALAGAAEALGCKLPDGHKVPASVIFFHIWSLSHGSVSLFRHGLPSKDLRAIGLPALLEQGVAIYLKGLGVALPSTFTTDATKT